jgi:hypothetical protein
MVADCWVVAVLWLLVAMIFCREIQFNNFTQKDQEQMNHPTNLASAYAMFLSADDVRKIGPD